MSNRRVRALAALAVVGTLALGACAPAPMAVPNHGPAAAAEIAAPAVESPSPTPRPTPTEAPVVEETVAPEPSPTVEESSSPEASAETSGSASAVPTESASAEPTPEPSPTLLPALWAPGAKGEAVREIQHRLLQIQWFDGDITEHFGPQTQAAIEGFQSKRGLPVTGEVDAVTWARLKDMTRMPTHDEMYNILKPGPALYAGGAKGDEVRSLQARLRQIGWYGGDVDGVYGPKTIEGVRGFQDKRGFPVTGEIDQRTLDKLREMTSKPTADELNNVKPKPKEPGKPKAMRLDERCLTGRAICISKTERKLAWVVDGQVQMTMDVRFGSTKTPTREGAFSVGWKSRDHVSSLYDSHMPYALFFSGGQAIHYSSDFAARGYQGASHGCVNVRDKEKVAKLFDLAKVGDKVIVYAD